MNEETFKVTCRAYFPDCTFKHGDGLLESIGFELDPDYYARSLERIAMEEGAPMPSSDPAAPSESQRPTSILEDF